MDEDLNVCLFIQRRPSRKFSLPGKAAREMAEELVILTNGDRAQIQAILSDLVGQYPDKCIDWYIEQAVNQLQKQRM
ncbi:hypothetical protein [Gloeothece verrucosa]|uniref:Uncharacterized protein n=1 Tax=Gloeothece verrucosa (strain PCC 7822) TaxID=497965 RepID=E0U5A3_GLOV7|nr:hypothetical protein [Gloeothece verrucosa]ADN13493.1 hypothetical protein Cyan7822_1497 [Gloeothece verrucosa PCC 7822]